MLAEKASCELRRLKFEESAPPLGPDWTSPFPSGSSALELALDGEVTVDAPAAELLLLAEAGQRVSEPAEARLLVDGKEVALTASSSATGWAATGQPVREHWLFLKGSVPGGHHRLALKLFGETPR